MSQPDRSSAKPCYRLQLAARRLAEPALLDLLKSVTECKDKQIAADLWRLAVVRPPPFDTQLLKVERPNAIELTLDRSCTHFGHG